MKRFLYSAFVFCVLTSVATNAQTDTLRLTLAQTEKQFLDSNLLLLSAKYAIDEKTALVTQAKIWDLPNLTVQHGAYQTQTRKWFPFDNSGETSMQVQQLILIAGKRSNQVKMALENKNIATSQFYDLLRSLKYQLRSDFYDIHFKSQTLKTYELELQMLGDVASKYEKLFADGIVSMKDVIRIKSLILTLQGEQFDLKKNLASLQAELSVFLKLPANKYIEPTGEFEPDTTYTSKINFSQLVDSAMNCRPDLMVASSLTSFSKYDIKYQKALSVPDIQLIAGWDQNASYILNYNYAGIAIDLPFWNRNKGNIRAAQSRYEQNQLQLQNMGLTIRREISNNVQKALETNTIYLKFNHTYLNEFSKLMEGANESFIKREINLLEFIDLYETFKESESQYNNLLFNCLMAKEDINYTVGKEIIK